MQHFQVDLHGLHVEEALQYTCMFLDQGWSFCVTTKRMPCLLLAPLVSACGLPSRCWMLTGCGLGLFALHVLTGSVLHVHMCGSLTRACVMQCQPWSSSSQAEEITVKATSPESCQLSRSFLREKALTLLQHQGACLLVCAMQATAKPLQTSTM